MSPSCSVFRKSPDNQKRHYCSSWGPGLDEGFRWKDRLHFSFKSLTKKQHPHFHMYVKKDNFCTKKTNSGIFSLLGPQISFIWTFWCILCFNGQCERCFKGEWNVPILSSCKLFYFIHLINLHIRKTFLVILSLKSLSSLFLKKVKTHNLLTRSWQSNIIVVVCLDFK